VRVYEELPGFEHLHLEDSWVLAIANDAEGVRLDLEAVMTDEPPRWKPPNAGEQYSYLRVAIVFSPATAVELELSGRPPATDATGETDFGNIDSFRWIADRFELEGDCGRPRAQGAQPIVVEAGPV